ncbi:MAG: xanthine dehydrogenase family protein molybdopterin-binding subunit, partial [Chloroflexi bacterium]|nr:xanthine dehydrogenase family protein molybdopterin-binding subunit [Chloroflexota bacterium]
MEEYAVIGKRVPKTDALELVTGKARFASDIKLPGMLVGKILRSPHGHAKPFGPNIADDVAIKVDKVRYFGDEVAAVAAVDEDTAEEALRLIEVEYELLPVVLDAEEAMKPEAPLIHEGVENNVCYQRSIRAGDIEKGFKEADLIIKEKFVTSKPQHAPLETAGCVVDWDQITGKLTMWKSTQSVFYDRISMAVCLGVPETKVRVIKPTVGGGFGSKTDGVMPMDVIAALLSKKTGRPVSIICDRWEETAATRTRHPQIRYVEMGFKKDGTITAHREKFINDTGAYVGMGPAVNILTCIFAKGPYKTENIWIDGYTVYTNKANSGPYRGFGTPQSTFIREQMLDKAAEKLGLDPLDLRRRNIINPEDCPFTMSQGLRINSSGVRTCLEEAAKAIGYEEKRKKKERNRGLGLATMFQWSSARDRPETNADFSSTYVKVNEDGTATVFSQASDLGQGVYTVCAQVVAEELGIRYEDVSVVTADTETTPPACLGTWGTRGALTAGNASKIAAMDAKERLMSVAAAMLEASAEDLEARDRRIYVKGSPEKGLPVSEVAHAAHFTTVAGEAGPILGRGYWDSQCDLPDEYLNGNMCATYSYAANAVEVEVDPETGKIEILSHAAAHDVGRALNPAICEGQIHGGTSHAIGYGLYEDMIYEPGSGRLLNATYLDYKIPTALDMPDVKAIH